MKQLSQQCSCHGPAIARSQMHPPRVCAGMRRFTPKPKKKDRVCPLASESATLADRSGQTSNQSDRCLERASCQPNHKSSRALFPGQLRRQSPSLLLSYIFRLITRAVAYYQCTINTALIARRVSCRCFANATQGTPSIAAQTSSSSCAHPRTSCHLHLQSICHLFFSCACGLLRNSLPNTARGYGSDHVTQPHHLSSLLLLVPIAICRCFAGLLLHQTPTATQSGNTTVVDQHACFRAARLFGPGVGPRASSVSMPPEALPLAILIPILCRPCPSLLFDDSVDYCFALLPSSISFHDFLLTCRSAMCLHATPSAFAACVSWQTLCKETWLLR